MPAKRFDSHIMLRGIVENVFCLTNSVCCYYLSSCVFVIWTNWNILCLTDPLEVASVSTTGGGGVCGQFFLTSGPFFSGCPRCNAT